MATVTFYEKPGCINNTRQKKLLAAAGHQVVAKNLLTEVWQAERLRAFFGDCRFGIGSITVRRRSNTAKLNRIS